MNAARCARWTFADREGQKELDVLPQQFGLAEAEELLYLAIRPDQKTLGVDDHDGVR